MKITVPKPKGLLMLSLISIQLQLRNKHQPQPNQQLIYFLQCQRPHHKHQLHHQVAMTHHMTHLMLILGAGFDLLGAMSPTPTTTATQMQPMTSTASSSANQNANRSVGTTWANGNTGKVNIDLANLGNPVQQKKSASMNELKSQMPTGNPGICSTTIFKSRAFSLIFLSTTLPLKTISITFRKVSR